MSINSPDYSDDHLSILVRAPHPRYRSKYSLVLGVYSSEMDDRSVGSHQVAMMKSHHQVVRSCLHPKNGIKMVLAVLKTASTDKTACNKKEF